jgi:hypothetical protein
LRCNNAAWALLSEALETDQPIFKGQPKIRKSMSQGRWMQFCTTVLLGVALAQTAEDTQCSDTISDSSSDPDYGWTWRENTTHPTATCNMPVVDAGASGLPLAALVQHLAAATTPMLIRGLLDLPRWQAQACPRQSVCPYGAVWR